MFPKGNNRHTSAENVVIFRLCVMNRVKVWCCSVIVVNVKTRLLMSKKVTKVTCFTFAAGI